MKHDLGSPLTPNEADHLAKSIAFLRKKSESGKTYLAEFSSAADLAQARQLLADLRKWPTPEIP